MNSLLRRLKSFFRASAIKIRVAQPNDANAIAEIEREAWGEKHIPAVETYEARIRLYPQGVLVAENRKGEMVGVVMASPCDIQNILSKNAISFSEIADGFGQNKEALDLWGITLSVPSRFSRTAAGTALALALFKMFLKGYRSFWLGSRVPDFKFICDLYEKEGLVPPSAEAYCILTVREVRQAIGDLNWKPWRKDHELVDSELEYYRKLGLKQIRIEPNYYSNDDPPVGVIITRDNPVYKMPKLFRLVLISVLGEIYSRITLYSES